MQDLLNMVLGDRNSDAVEQIGKKFNLGTQETTRALQHLLPSLQQGMHQNSQQQNGMEALQRALSDGRNEQYIEKPERIVEQGAVDNGNAILGHLLGSKNTSRKVAEQAANQTGFDSGVLKQMLPLAANLLMGSLSKETQSQDEERSFLHQVLDMDNDNSVLDDAAGIIGKLF
ncbi:DUF937 domain-containing protein [Kangiella shandongensis]|uniref:DUF937 domain-containing protein n=1 Tax=Kangiella shandongensis TaxID=2763258 RepID=UPI001CC187FD|nr:DUF937 domain-containing protein [Kangiella shandongensis]